MASWSSTTIIQLSHQECERADVTNFGAALPLQFAKPALEVGIEEADPAVQQFKLKVDNNTYIYYNLFINGPPELALNHVMIYIDLVYSASTK